MNGNYSISLGEGSNTTAHAAAPNVSVRSDLAAGARVKLARSEVQIGQSEFDEAGNVNPDHTASTSSYPSHHEHPADANHAHHERTTDHSGHEEGL
jgi:hypothetical protein